MTARHVLDAASFDPGRLSDPVPPPEQVLLGERHLWMTDAACHGRTTLFFGIAGERPERRARREARARKVCAGCLVLNPCRKMARTNGENGF